MQFEQIETLLEKYYNGETSLEEESQLKRFFQQTKLLPDHLKPEAAQFRHYAQEQSVEMDKFLADDWLFEKIENPVLAVQGSSQKTESTSFFKTYVWQIAASISLLIVAFWAGNYFQQTGSVSSSGEAQVVALEQKTQERKPEVETAASVENPMNTAISTVNQEREEETYSSARRQPAKPVLVASSTVRSSSASDRLQLVSQDLKTEGLTPQESKKIIKLLVKTMNQDGNLNVRLAACEALYQFKDHKEVRKAFIHALGTQTEPLMQLTLIEMVVKLKEATAVPQLEMLMHKEDLLPIVKYKAQEGLGTLI
ncbi:HEAT repeat domain-containing protein [Rufibacter latericius]|uniref:HEAT repeat domain-containing protein n=1 Tax=Rufibacter latericius TaxID=2487040 RepID=A0A3M9MFG0_9BACT|nr:HEAT repeat domain-containing protein [Rufibacter latericius]RNI23603.1 HEAT repeat domain-containing protein [Rufibacter latericius]